MRQAGVYLACLSGVMPQLVTHIIIVRRGETVEVDVGDHDWVANRPREELDQGLVATARGSFAVVGKEVRHFNR